MMTGMLDVFIADMEVQASFVDEVLPGGRASRHIHFLIGKYKSQRNNFMDLSDPDVIKYRAERYAQQVKEGTDDNT